MKKTKLFLLSALIFAGLTFTGCNNGTSNGNGETGGTGSGKEDSKVFSLSKDGKTVTIDYTNETEEEQKFLVFAGENLGYNFKGNFELYEQETDSPYEFGMIFDYYEEERSVCLIHCDILKLSILNKENNRTQYKYQFGTKDGFPLEDFENFNFYPFYSYSNIIEDEIILKNSVDNRFVFAVRENNDKIIASTPDLAGFKLNPKATVPTKFGYYLIIPAGSTCHLKLTISDLK